MSVRRTALGALVVALGALGITPAVDAAPDTTPPTLRLDPAAHYRVGGQVSFADDPDEGPVWDADYYLKWQASDPAGICSQRVTEQSYDTLGGDEDPVLGWDTTTKSVAAGARAYDFSRSSFDWNRIGDRWLVRSTDCAGNTATSSVASTRWGLVDDDGSSWRSAAAPALSYGGTWSVAGCSCFVNGTTHQTRSAGSSVTVTAGPGRPVGLVMATGPGRGRVDVYVDGVRTRTVDTYAATNRNRVVVWQTLLGSGQHTVEVVNKATPGRPRTDIDAILL